VINDLSFILGRQETLGIVGESGCGKSMTALAILGLVPSPPGRIASGKVLFNGEDLTQATDQRLRKIRGKQISMIFQEPMTSLNPVFSVGEQIAETLQRHEKLNRRDALDRSIELLRSVRIPAPKKRIREYPYQMSGGMRQRVMIAMALACRPTVLIADEPTTALDVTVQAQILDLLQELQDQLETALILITHDIGVISEMAKRVVVMYAGNNVEEGAVADILTEPKHPYTKGLISCIPRLQMNPAFEVPSLPEIPGVVPPLSQLGSGCPFAPRCQFSTARCVKEMPNITTIGPGHTASCWLLRGDISV
jgi:peptide/nickel transport system ATP-binding protein